MRCPRHSDQGFLVCVCVSVFPLLFFSFIGFAFPALLLVLCAGKTEGDTCLAKRRRCRICVVCAEYCSSSTGAGVADVFVLLPCYCGSCCCCLYSSSAMQYHSYTSPPFVFPCRQKYECVVLLVLLWFSVGFMRVLGRFFGSFVAPTYVAETPYRRFRSGSRARQNDERVFFVRPPSVAVRLVKRFKRQESDRGRGRGRVFFRCIFVCFILTIYNISCAFHQRDAALRR